MFLRVLLLFVFCASLSPLHALADESEGSDEKSSPVIRYSMEGRLEKTVEEQLLKENVYHDIWLYLVGFATKGSRDYTSALFILENEFKLPRGVFTRAYFPEDDLARLSNVYFLVIKLERIGRQCPWELLGPTWYVRPQPKTH